MVNLGTCPVMPSHRDNSANCQLPVAGCKLQVAAGNPVEAEVGGSRIVCPIKLLIPDKPWGRDLLERQTLGNYVLCIVIGDW